jgi:hypothetical protein
MRDELVRRNYAATTIQTYLYELDTCRRQHPGRRLDRLGPRELRRYQAYLFEERKLAIGTVGVPSENAVLVAVVDVAADDGYAVEP